MNKRGKKFFKIFSLIFLAVVVLLIIGNINFISAPFQDNTSLQQNVYDCGGILNTSNGYYSLNRSINSTGTCITILADNITLDCKGFNINYSTGGTLNTYGIYITKFNTTIKNCNITDGNWSLNAATSRYGIYLTSLSSSNSTLFNNSVNTSNSYAIYLYNGADNNNVSFNNATSNSSFGISISSTDGNILTNNNGASNKTVGIFLNSNSNIIFTNNNGTSNTSQGIYLSSNTNSTFAYNNGTGLGVGIYCQSNDNSLFANNTGRSNSQVGIDFNSNTNSNLTGNNGTSNSSWGIDLTSNSNIIFTNNIGISNSNIGINLNSNSNNILTGNNGTSNISTGIYLQFDENTLFVNNTGTSKTNTGIYVSGSSNDTLTGNNGTSNSSFGISIDSTTDSIFTNNLGISNKSSGIILSSSNNTLVNNIGTSNSGYGIYLVSCSNDTLTGNNGTSNTSFGIYLDSSSNNNLTNNIGKSNSSSGIYFSVASDNLLTGNTGISNKSSGILLQNSLNNAFIQPTAKGLLAGSYGVYFDSSNNTLFKDCINITGALYDVYFSSNLTSANNTFVNCSYNSSNEFVNSTDGQIIKKWYYRTHVNNTHGNSLSNVNLVISNVSGTVASTTTDSSGNVIQQLTDYVNTGGTTTYASNYTVTATLSGYDSSSKTFNLTTFQNINDFFTLSLTPVVSPPQEDQSGGSLPPSSGNTYVPAAINDNFWTQTTTVSNEEWQTPAENQGENSITETEAQILEQQLINELKMNPNAETQEITIKEITENLSAGERLKVDVKNSSYYVGVANVSSDSVVVQVSKSGGGGATQSLMKIGDVKKFDLNNDGLTDMKIEIVSLEPSAKAGIKIEVVYNGLLNAKEIQKYNQEQKSNKLLMFAFIFIGVLVAVTIYFRFRKYK